MTTLEMLLLLISGYFSGRLNFLFVQYFCSFTPLFLPLEKKKRETKPAVNEVKVLL